MTEHVIFRYDPIISRRSPSAALVAGAPAVRTRSVKRVRRIGPACRPGCTSTGVRYRRSSNTSKAWSVECGCAPKSVPCTGINPATGCCCKSCSPSRPVCVTRSPGCRPRGAEPVVVLVEPDQMLATLLDQMSARDALLAVHSDDNGSVGWNVLYGTDSIGAQDVPRATDDSAFRAMSLSGFTQTCTGGRVVLRQSAAGLAS